MAITINFNTTVLPAKGDSYVMVLLKSHQGFIFVRALNTQVIYRLALAQVECTS